jgi:alanine racemase
MAAGPVSEAVVLKESVPSADVISLLGPLDGPEYRAVAERDIIPFVGSREQLGV